MLNNSVTIDGVANVFVSFVLHDESPSAYRGRVGIMAFRATQALRMAVTKTSTGLVGLAVDPNGRVNYINMGKKILDRVKVGSVCLALVGLMKQTNCIRGTVTCYGLKLRTRNHSRAVPVYAEENKKALEERM